MIIDFTLENWMSFREPVTFTMQTGKSEKHSTRVLKDEKFGLNLLPVAAILGGNASGKTNFISALDFARNFIVNGINGSGTIRATPYLLNEKSKVSPTKFMFKLLIDDKIYEYMFEVTRETVVSESLTEITDNEKQELFVIDRKRATVYEKFGENYNILEQVFNIKKINQLFLTTICKDFNVKNQVYSWFKENLSIIFPETESNIFYSSYFEYKNILSTVNDLLKTLDCGVDEINFVPYESSERERSYFSEQLKEKDFVFDPKTLVFAKLVDGKIETSRLVTFHKSDRNESVEFEMHQESKGTLRVLDLLPVFLKLTQSGKNHVFVIDEVEQSLHTHMVQNLVRAYLGNCKSSSNSQLIFSTHNVQLMSERILRTDEMWLAKRNKSGESFLNSIDSFGEVQDDENIVDAYLTGQFGGIPKMLLLENQLKLEVESLGSE